MGDDYEFNFGGDVDEDEEMQWQLAGRSATIYVVDAAPQMFQKNDDSNHFSTAIKVITGDRYGLQHRQY